MIGINPNDQCFKITYNIYDEKIFLGGCYDEGVSEETIKKVVNTAYELLLEKHPNTAMTVSQILNDLADQYSDINLRNIVIMDQKSHIGIDGEKYIWE